MEIRLIQDAPAAGTWNMAVDEALGESLERGASPDGSGQGGNLRFYTWAPSTLSLGYFQNLDDRCEHAASRGCELVRRASGGGAILHDRELTYSLTLAVGRHVDADLQSYYGTLHQTLIDTLADFGVTAQLCENPFRRERRAEPFLCFQRRSAGDVLIGEHKIAGSAQRRYRTVLLQQGSILLERSDHAPELPGIAQLTGVTLSAAELSERWRERIASRLDWTLRPEGLREKDVSLATERVQTRYANDTWTARR